MFDALSDRLERISTRLRGKGRISDEDLDEALTEIRTALLEADVELSLRMLQWSKVRAVALIAGEWGNQIAGERKNVDELAAQGFPIRLWVMPRAGHAYSANIEDIMREAIAFVLSHEHDG